MKLKRSKKKGFTLIELIVVIAILGILAAIAIPRFSGFTSRAKIANDEQYAALVANATMVMIAAGDLNYTAGTDVTISIAPSGTVATITNATFGSPAKLANIGAYRTALNNMVAITTLKGHTAGMQVVANDAGVKSVTAATVAEPTP